MSLVSAPWPHHDPLRAVLDTALDAVVVMDVDGLVRGWNGCAEETFGYRSTEALGQPLADLIIPERYRDAHWKGLQRYLETGAGPVLNQHIEISALRRDGEEFPVELSITPTHYGAGAAFLGFLRDISDRKAAEADMERRARNAELMFRVTAMAAETGSSDEALRATLDAILEITDWPLGHAFRLTGEDAPRLEDTAIWRHRGQDRYAPLREATAQIVFARGQGLPGQILERGEPVWLEQTDVAPSFLRARVAARCGLHAAFGFAIKSSGRPIAILEFFSEAATPPDSELLLTVRALGEQVGRVFERRQAEDRLRADKAALEREVEERGRVERHRELLLAELNHRVKNVLAVIHGIAAQTARTSPSLEAFSVDFEGRLASLARAHDLLTAQDCRDTDVRAVAQSMLAPWLEGDGRIALSGPEMVLDPQQAVSFSLVLHELMTNAVKYGALSRVGGAVRLEWDASADREEPMASVRWVESGLGSLAAPTRRGFGTRMIAAAARDFGGTSTLDWRPEGLSYELRFPLSRG